MNEVHGPVNGGVRGSRGGGASAPVDGVGGLREKLRGARASTHPPHPRPRTVGGCIRS